MLIEILKEVLYVRLLLLLISKNPPIYYEAQYQPGCDKHRSHVAVCMIESNIYNIISSLTL